MSWKLQAKCRGLDPELFYPERGRVPVEAKEACEGCPVRLQCLEAGMGEKWGVWGGVSERERRRLRRRRLQSA